MSMDAALRNQVGAFKNRALAQPSISKKSRDEPAEKKRKKTKHSISKKLKTSGAQNVTFDYKTATSSVASSQFGTLTRIVDYMKKRHLDGSDWALTLDEILQELLIFDANSQTKNWLANEALPKNTKLAVNEADRFLYNPPLKVKGKTSLLALLKKYDLEGKGGILMSELSDSVADVDKLVESLGSDVVTFPTNFNKRKDTVIFFNDSSSFPPILDEFQAIWRKVNMELVEEAKIEEYLNKQGITSMATDLGKKKNGPVPKRRAPRKSRVKVHNEHMVGVLQDFAPV